MVHVLAIITGIDPQHRLLVDPELPARFAALARGAVERDDYPRAAEILEASAGFVAGDPTLDALLAEVAVRVLAREELERPAGAEEPTGGTFTRHHPRLGWELAPRAEFARAYLDPAAAAADMDDYAWDVPVVPAPFVGYAPAPEGLDLSSLYGVMVAFSAPMAQRCK